MEQVGSVRVRELTDDEIDMISGAWGLPGAAFGAFVGAMGYAGYAATSGNGTWAGFAVATVGGALAGAAGGPVSAVSGYLVPRISAATGAVSGLVDGSDDDGGCGD